MTIPENTTSHVISIGIEEDEAVEGEEVFVIDISADNSQVVVVDAQAVVRLQDNDIAALGFEVVDEVVESAGSVEVALTLDSPVPFDVDVEVSTGSTGDTDTATAGDDYTAISAMMITIPAMSQRSDVFTISILEDEVVESAEVFTVSATTSSAVVSTGTRTASTTVTIIDNDTATLSIQGEATVTVSEGNAAPLGLTLSLDKPAPEDVEVMVVVGVDDDPDTVNVSVDDYSGMLESVIIPAGETELVLPISIEDDDIVEGEEVLTVTISTEATNINIENSTVTVTVTDNDSAELSMADVSVVENVVEGRIQIELVLSHMVGYATSVMVSTGAAGDSAVANEDYTPLNGHVETIAANTLRHEFDIEIIDDVLVENDESFTVTITTETANVSVPDSVSIVNIDSDDTFLMEIMAGDYDVLRVPEESTMLEMVIQLNRGTSELSETVYATIVTSDIDGGAEAGMDYVALDQEVSFAPGQVSMTTTFMVTNDSINEMDESIRLVLQPPSASRQQLEDVIVNQLAVALVIVDDDEFEIEIEPAASVMVNEGEEEPNAYTIALTSEPLADVMITITSLNTEVVGVSPETLNFSVADWETPKPITLRGVADTNTENEAITIRHVAAGGGYDDYMFEYEVGVVDNGLVSVGFGLESSVVSEMPEEMMETVDYVINFTAPVPDNGLRLRVMLSGSATIGDDYAVSSAGAAPLVTTDEDVIYTLSVAQGDISATISLNSIDDSDDDDNETILLTLLSEDWYIVTENNKNNIVIIDDDENRLLVWLRRFFIGELMILDPSDGRLISYSDVVDDQSNQDSNVDIDLLNDPGARIREEENCAYYRCIRWRAEAFVSSFRVYGDSSGEDAVLNLRRGLASPPRPVSTVIVDVVDSLPVGVSTLELDVSENGISNVYKLTIEKEMPFLSALRLRIQDSDGTTTTRDFNVSNVSNRSHAIEVQHTVESVTVEAQVPDRAAWLYGGALSIVGSNGEPIAIDTKITVNGEEADQPQTQASRFSASSQVQLGAAGSRSTITVGAGLSSIATEYEIDVYRHRPPVPISFRNNGSTLQMVEGGATAVREISISIGDTSAIDLLVKMTLEEGRLSIADVRFDSSLSSNGNRADFEGRDGNTFTYRLTGVGEFNFAVAAVSDGVVEGRETADLVIAPGLGYVTNSEQSLSLSISSSVTTEKLSVDVSTTDIGSGFSTLAASDAGYSLVVPSNIDEVHFEIMSGESTIPDIGYRVVPPLELRALGASSSDVNLEIRSGRRITVGNLSEGNNNIVHLELTAEDGRIGTSQISVFRQESSLLTLTALLSQNKDGSGAYDISYSPEGDRLVNVGDATEIYTRITPDQDAVHSVRYRRVRDESDGSFMLSAMGVNPSSDRIRLGWNDPEGAENYDGSCARPAACLVKLSGLVPGVNTVNVRLHLDQNDRISSYKFRVIVEP
ncbi:MAG: Calx-beta domain-containing protein [Candidatus Porifericomitaceae bacterium WSBS_2022_MAG_OTU9]